MVLILLFCLMMHGKEADDDGIDKDLGVSTVRIRSVCGVYFLGCITGTLRMSYDKTQRGKIGYAALLKEEYMIYEFYAIRVYRCPQSTYYQNIFESLKGDVMIGKRGKLCDSAKAMRFATKEQAQEWIASFLKRRKEDRDLWEMVVAKVTTNRP